LEHYVYRIEYLKPRDERKYYIGKHSGEIEDMGTSYFTSGVIKEDFILNNKDYKVKIIYKGFDAKDAIRFESKIHKRLNVSRNPKFFNLINQSPKGLDTTGLTFAINKKTKIKEMITTDEYKNNKDLYEYNDDGYLNCFDKLEDKYTRVTYDEYNSNKNRYVHPTEGMVNCILLKTNEKVYITSEEYRNNKHLYKHVNKGNVICKNKNTGEIMRVSCDELKDNDNLIHINEGRVVCYDKVLNVKTTISKEIYRCNKDRYNHSMVGKTIVTRISDGKKIAISSEEYRNNKHLYKHMNKGKISARNKHSGESLSLTKKEFENNRHIYEYISKGIVHDRKECPQCQKNVSVSCFARHMKSHDNKMIWLNDNQNQNTILVTETEYYTNLTNTHYKPKGRERNCLKIAYIDGEEIPLSKLIKLRSPK